MNSMINSGHRIAILSIVVVVGLILAAPSAIRDVSPRAGILVYAGFHPLCHQLSGRCWTVASMPLPVCSRCFGLYVGAAVGLLLLTFPRWRCYTSSGPLRRRWLVLAGLPMLADVLLRLGGWRANVPDLEIRSLTGLLLGVVAVFYLVPVLEAARRELLNKYFFQEERI